MRSALWLLVLAGCSRTGTLWTAEDAAPPDDGAPAVDRPDAEAPEPHQPPPETPCEPEQERCDGRDNDCNGQIDDGLAPEPCDGGGFRFCVGGSMSACPRICAVCRPNAERVCFPAYCSRWGAQVCEADGLAWGPCRERPAPIECQGLEDTWDAADDSPETETCCVERGDCCQDHWDLDGDGDTGESVGACEAVTCEG